MKVEQTYQEQALVERYIAEDESSASILVDIGISKSSFYNWL